MEWMARPAGPTRVVRLKAVCRAGVPLYLPDEWRFRTVCRDGVPWLGPSWSLMDRRHVGRGSSRAIDTYAERLLPFCKWLDRKHVGLGAPGSFDWVVEG